MIQKIEHSKKSEAAEISRVFQVSYTIEAQLLGAKKFPPLLRPIISYKNSKNDFFGFYEHDNIVAVIEMKQEQLSMHIQSLVVDPEYFRMGIASKLIRFVLNQYECGKFTVETGRENAPARKLYERFGFQLIKTYTAEEDIVKVRYMYHF